jgi:phosphatidylglycerol:prolipoprotein diacylglycerol transferase
VVNIRIDPILLRWGTIMLSWHGLCLAAGVLVVYAVAVRVGARQGFARQSLSELALGMILLGLTGARLLSVLGDWSAYAAHPAQVLAVWEGGLTVNGAILGGVVAAVLYAWYKHLDAWKLLDVLALAVPLGYIVGRVGCTINGDVWGLPTGGSWGLVYWSLETSLPPALLGVPTFPIPIVLQVWSLAILALLLVLRGRAPRAGLLASTFLILYGTGRLVANTWQPGEPVWLGLKYLQLLALGFILLGSVCLVYLHCAGGPARYAPARGTAPRRWWQIGEHR